MASQEKTSPRDTPLSCLRELAALAPSGPESVLDWLKGNLPRFGITKYSLYRFKNDPPVLEATACTNLSAEVNGFFIETYNAGRLKSPLATGRPALKFNFQATKVAGMVPGADAKALETYLSLPLVSGQSKLGLLNIFQLPAGRALNQKRLDFFILLAAQVASQLLWSRVMASPYELIKEKLALMLLAASEGKPLVLARLEVIPHNMTAAFNIAAFIENIRSRFSDEPQVLTIDFNRLIVFFKDADVTRVCGSLNEIAEADKKNYVIKYRVTNYPADSRGPAEIMYNLCTYE